MSDGSESRLSQVRNRVTLTMDLRDIIHYGITLNIQPSSKDQNLINNGHEQLSFFT